MPAQHVVEAVLDATPARALAALLDLPNDEIQAGWPLPPLWHWVYLLHHPASAELGPDGHPRHGWPGPPRPGLRRMFAGGRVRTHRPLRVGAAVRSRVSITGSRDITGRSGAMTIMTTTRIYEQDDEPAVTEEQDIVYREPVSAAPATPTSPPEGAASAASSAAADGTEIALDPAYLFRFSALTYNAHRIHYDIDYCREVEGYAGLVVHGPLQALLMTEAARRIAPAESGHFEFRLVSPLFLGQGLRVAATPKDHAVVCSVAAGDGRETATGTWRPQR